MTTRARRADARRNVEAILDAGLAVLGERPEAGLAAVAQRAGVTRTTLYAHFPSREALLDALVRRTVEHAARAIDEARVDEGDPADALARLARASWLTIDRHRAMLRAASGAVPRERVRAHHAPVEQRLAALVERGQRERAFRGDVPAAWLVAVFFGLVHAAREEVDAGRLPARDALGALEASLLGAFGAEGRAPGRSP